MLIKSKKLNDVAKHLNMKYSDFTSLLIKERVVEKIDSRYIPFGRYISKGWFLSNEIKVSSGGHNFNPYLVIVTNYGFSELVKLVESILYTELDSVSLYDDVSIYVCDFLKDEKFKKTTETIENNTVSIYSKKTLILKYNTESNKIWLPKKAN